MLAFDRNPPAFCVPITCCRLNTRVLEHKKQNEGNLTNKIMLAYVSGAGMYVVFLETQRGCCHLQPITEHEVCKVRWASVNYKTTAGTLIRSHINIKNGRSVLLRPRHPLVRMRNRIYQKACGQSAGRLSSFLNWWLEMFLQTSSLQNLGRRGLSWRDSHRPCWRAFITSMRIWIKSSNTKKSN